MAAREAALESLCTLDDVAVTRVRSDRGQEGVGGVEGYTWLVTFLSEAGSQTKRYASPLQAEVGHKLDVDGEARRAAARRLRLRRARACGLR